MSYEYNMELYKKAMIKTNEGFTKLGLLIKNNAQFLANNMRQDEVLFMIEEITPIFEEGYKNFNLFYEELEKDLKTNLNEYIPFLEHVIELFPQNLSDLDKTIKNVNNLKIDTEKLLNIIEKIKILFNNILELAHNLK